MSLERREEKRLAPEEFLAEVSNWPCCDCEKPATRWCDGDSWCDEHVPKNMPHIPREQFLRRLTEPIDEAGVPSCELL